MAKRMLIDATHPEESRVAIVDGSKLEDYEAETSTKKQFKGNIYLAKVIRIEPSLQAAFVEYGHNRHGFLPFAEIHPDYYRIPVGDRPPSEMAEELPEESISSEEDLQSVLPEATEGDPTGDLAVDENMDVSDEEAPPARRQKQYQYKIQEVIKRRQIMLIQVVKEERGNKGAALTTYLSLPGRYCVLMPNAGHRSGGISRKIAEQSDRAKLREILNELPIPEGMSLIVRTAGQDRNKLEIKRDFEYLIRLWGEIREKTLSSIAPTIVYEEGNLIKRTIRDNYSKDILEILVEGEDGYKEAKTFIKNLMPSHAKKVKLYKDEVPLLQRYNAEAQIDAIMSPSAGLPSGGSIVINPTEALVAIDVNSGKSTRERHIDETALKTNLEAADEIARQIRMRDLGGLVVIDFIDMADQKHVQAVEKRLREAVRNDRARIQMGRISQFGLMELSRQRLRPSIHETNMHPCSHCRGTGMVRSVESSSLLVLRAIETAGLSGKSKELVVTVPAGIDLYLLNQKRTNILLLEQRYSMSITIQRDDSMVAPEYRIDNLGDISLPQREERHSSRRESSRSSYSDEGRGEGGRSDRGQQRRGRNQRRSFSDEGQGRPAETPREEPTEESFEETSATPSQEREQGGHRNRQRRNPFQNRRRRRGGEYRPSNGENQNPVESIEAAIDESMGASSSSDWTESTGEQGSSRPSSDRPEGETGGQERHRRRRRRRGNFNRHRNGENREGGSQGAESSAPQAQSSEPERPRDQAPSESQGGSSEAKPSRRRSGTGSGARSKSATPDAPANEKSSGESTADKKKKRGFWSRLLEA